MRARTVNLSEIDAIDAAGVHWLPLRRELGISAFGTNAYRADAGEQLIEPHTEGSGEEEMYVLLAGAATFTLDGEEIEATAGFVVFCPEGDIHRGAVATANGTVALAVGNAAGAAGPLPAWQHRFTAHPHAATGDYVAAYSIASDALSDHPGDASTHYDLACWAAMGGQRERALEHWRRAIAANPKAREWAEGDADLDPIRDAL